MSTEYERIAGVINATPEERDRLRRLAESMAPTLPDFLLARIAEDEAAARMASPGGWQYGDVASVAGGSLYDESRMIASLHYEQPDDHDGRIVRHLLSDEADANGAHIVRHDPARVLAECEAKRRIVDWHRLIDGLDTEDNPVRGCGSCIASGAEPPYIIAGPCLTVRLLALPYADHPDYRQEWRP